MPSLESDYPGYLQSKRSVDDRAVNERVLRRLTTELDGRRRLRVLNLGAGIGGAVERLIERDVFPAASEISWTLVDVREENVEAARERVPAWARSQGYAVTGIDDSTDESGDATGLDDAGRIRESEEIRADGRFRIDTGTRSIGIEPIVADAFEVIEEGEWDLLVGQAFLDLFEVGEVLPRLLAALSPGGLCYFPITFDGGTVFEPAVEAIDPDRLGRSFHDHIDRNGGDSRAGRHLLTEIPRVGGTVLAAGSSDWVVHARDGTYPADEQRFLRFIIDTIADALTGDDGSELDEEALRAWRERRRRQLENGELVYIAHQLDVLGRVDESELDEPGSR